MNASIRKLLLFTTLIAGFASLGHAALIVNWGGNYVTSAQPFSNLNGANNQYGGFSGGDPLLLSPSSLYSGTSATFYGKVQLTSSGTFSVPSGSGGTGIINIDTNNDRIEIKQNSESIDALILWKQPNFLNGLSSGTLDLGTGSTFSITTTTFANGVGGRAVLRLGNNYYISGIVFNSVNTFSVDLTTLAWFNYDPANSLSTIGSSAIIFSGGQISNVTEVGFFTGTTSAGSNAVRITSVQFNAVAIPEPAAAVPALLGALGIGLWLRRRSPRAITAA